MSSFGTGLPVCFLSVPGRRSGRVQTVPLLYGREGATLVVAESNWGRPSRPAWALNLEAAGRATVTIAGRPQQVRARRATPGEAERWWPLLLGIWPGWEGYRRRAGREIALYALEPDPPA